MPKTREMLRREAAAWMARLQSGRDPQIERKFQRWHDRDPAHASAFERVSKSYQQAGLLRYSTSASLAGDARAYPAYSRKRPSFALAAAAALVLLLSAGTFLFLRAGRWTSSTEAVMLSTKVGEIRSITLADGSKVTLDTNSRVDVDIEAGSRRARVKAGRARFEVAKASQPFVIEAGNSTATVETAMLDVEKFDTKGSIEILSGAARVDGRERSAMIQADLPGHRGRSPVATDSDWTHGMLEFAGTPLPEAVALANRYSERKIILGEGLEKLKVTGAFRAGNVEGLASALAAAFHLSVKRVAGGSLVLAAET